MSRTIEPGFYDIPGGYIVKVFPGAVRFVVKPRTTHKLKPDDYRCKDCVHQVEGYAAMASYHRTNVCELRPKKLKTPSHDRRAIFYAARNLGHICKRFELRTEL